MSQVVFLLDGGGALVGLFVAAVLAARPGGNRRAGLVLSVLMVLLALSIVYPLLFEYWPALKGMHAVVVIEPFQFLVTPLMALYALLLLVPDYRLRRQQVLHLLPFVLIGAFSVLRIPPTFLPQARSMGPAIMELIWGLLVVQAVVYVVPVSGLLFRYQHSLRNQVSSLAGIDLNWLWWFVHLFLALTAVYALLLVVALHGPQPFGMRAYLSVALTVIVFVVGQRALLQKQVPVVEGLAPAREARGAAAASAGSAAPERVVVTPEEASEIRTRLLRAMDEDRLYLDSELSLSDLADRLGATRNQVSYVINRHLGRNFYDFVNEYRVRDVIRRMNEGEAESLKITALAFDAGFNSKPAFNAVFKKHTGLTPSEYRRRNPRPRKLSSASS